MTPRAHTLPYLLAGAFHRMAFFAWGDQAAPAVVCVHGLSRNAHDFDVLAEHLAARFYVICPDLPGRGGSDWLDDKSLYQPQSYVAALAHLLAFLDRPVAWVGTSLGGICGMMLAAAAGTPIRRLVLNDIGPFIPKAALARIVDYVARVPDFADLGALEAYLRQVHAPFGALSDAQWARMAASSSRRLESGRLALHYDPGLSVPMLAAPVVDLDLWGVWERIGVPTLTLRGVESDLLLPWVFQRMGERSALHEVPEAGHAPALMDGPSIDVVARFLEAAPIGS